MKPRLPALGLAALLAGACAGPAPAPADAERAPGVHAAGLALSGPGTARSGPFKLSAAQAHWDAKAERAELSGASLTLAEPGWRLAAPRARYEAGSRQVVLLGGGGGNAKPGSQALDFEADRTVFEPEAGRVTLSGAVRLTMGAVSLTCDSAVLGVPKGGGPVERLQCDGSVVLTRGDDVLKAKSLSYDASARRWTATGRPKARFTLPAGAPAPGF